MQPRLRCTGRARPGFSLMEAALASIIVAIMLGAGLTAVTQATKARHLASDQAVARHLAQALLEEASAKQYESSLGAALEPSPSEDQNLRTTLNDCDDYIGLDISPITDELGNPLTDGAWRATMRVAWADRSDMSESRMSDTGVKRISVVIYKGNKTLAAMSTIKTRGWEEVQ